MHDLSISELRMIATMGHRLSRRERADVEAANLAERGMVLADVRREVIVGWNLTQEQNYGHDSNHIGCEKTVEPPAAKRKHVEYMDPR